MSGLAGHADLHKAFGTQPVLTGLDLSVPAGSLHRHPRSVGQRQDHAAADPRRLRAARPRHGRDRRRVGRRRPRHVAPEHRRIGYVPQEGSLFPHLTVQANVGFGLPARQRDGGAGRRAARDGGPGRPRSTLPASALRRPAAAGGAGACARVEPELVLLDEPFASLDAHLRPASATTCTDPAQPATTALLVTHDQDEALSIADQVAVMRGGRIAQWPAAGPLRPPGRRRAGALRGRGQPDRGTLDGELVETPFGRLPAQWRHAPAPTPLR